MKKHESLQVLRIGLPGPWNTIHPGLQHTLFGDLVLSNQFEALVGTNDNGVSIPLGATGWEISDDFRVFRFHIDTTRTFSDGSRLTAQDFKRSWETAVKLVPVSANSSLLDVLYKIKGFGDLERKGGISGIRVVAEDLLEIHFSSAFRRALEHLQGNRFAAYKEVDGKFLGTGIFEIEEVGPDHLVMRPRTDLGLSSVPILDVRYFPSEGIITKLLSGEIDAIHYMSGHAEDASSLPESIGLVVGQSSLHFALSLNNKRNSFFSASERRRALQYLIYEMIRKERSLLPSAPLFDVDLQFFMPFQAGRLDENEVNSLVSVGQKWVSELIEASKSRPVLVKGTPSTRKIIDLLKASGLHLSSESGVLSPKEFVALSYAPDGPDILVDNFSVASGDPDGIYHVLGKSGAIRTPYVYSEVAGELLEEGRKLVDISALDAHYKDTSRALLTDVPMVHLGFARALTLFRNDSVEINTKILRRNQGQLHFLRVKQ